MNPSLNLAEQIKAAAREAGFELCGVAPLRQYPEFESFATWIRDGHAADMKYLESREEAGNLKRASPRETFPWARSVIVCAINYNAAEPYSTQAADNASGWISRYAWSREDYHDAVLRKLRQVESALLNLCDASGVAVRSYVDTGPLIERVFAKHAGIGWVGKNTCIINQGIGSWLFLGVILTSIDFPDDIAAFIPAPDRCGTCTRCIDACPTDAITAPYHLDSNLCISYLTIEKRGAIPESLRSGMGRQVFGCDICQDVCPWNRKALATSAPEFQPREGLVNPALDWLAGMNEEEYRERFRGSPIRRTKRSGLRRNAVNAMGNSGNAGFLPMLEKLKADEDPVVSDAATWAYEQLRKTQNQ
jgi:epoxyqueuosine reductase